MSDDKPEIRGPLFAEVERLAKVARDAVRGAGHGLERGVQAQIESELEDANGALCELLRLLANERADRLDAAIADQRKLNESRDVFNIGTTPSEVSDAQ